MKLYFAPISSIMDSNTLGLCNLSGEIFANLPVAIFERFLDEFWTVKCISAGITQILGEASEALFAEDSPTFLRFILPLDFPKINQGIREQLERQQSYAVEYRLIKLTGQVCWVQEQGKGVYDEDGSLIGVKGLVLAVGDHTRREQHLFQERQMLQHLIMDAPVAIAMFDPEMNYLAYSYQWLLDFEIETKRDSLMGCSHYKLFPNLPEEWYELHRQALQGESICRPEESFVLPSGRLVYFRRSIQPWYNHLGEVGGIVIVNQVINQLVEAREAAIALVNIKSQFLATMSHELRTPLGGIVSIAELLSKTRLTPRQQNLTETLIKSADHLRLIINDILDFSKLESAAMQLERIDFSFYQEIDFITKLLGEEAHNKKIELYTLIDPNIPQTVQGDPLRLRQILTNLVHNAIKFTQQGEVVIRIAIIESTSQQLLLKFSVTDTGAGIPADVRKRLFNAFTQGDIDISRRYGGTGLGLAISKQLVELMGGRIELESTVGEGSTFWFTVPLQIQQNEPDQITTPLLNFDAHDLAMLVVDGQIATHRLLQYYAGHCGIACDQVSTLSEAIAMLGEKNYQIVFVSFEGVQHLLTELEELQERFPLTQVVMILHPSDHQLLMRTFPNASWQYLFKPIQINHLFACFQEMMSNGENPLTITANPDYLEQDLDLVTPVHSLKILVADDAKINRDVVCSQLEYLGYNDVTCVEDGEAVLKAIATDYYDLVLMDCMMPKLDGYQATQLIRQQFSETDIKPLIIAMTGNALPEERQKCIDAGMNDYLVKPIEIETLRKMLTHWHNEKLPIVTSYVPEKNAILGAYLPLIDFQRLHNLIPEDPIWQQEFLGEYQEASAEYLHHLRMMLASRNIPKIEYYAHQLKGISQMAAINFVPKIAENIEILAGEQDFEAIAIELEKLQLYLDAIYQHIATHYDQHNQP